MIQRLETAKDMLSLIESHYEEGAYDRASRELERARERYPDDLTFMEWSAVLAGEENRPRDALELLERVLRQESRRSFALREKSAVLLGLGRFEDALEIFLQIGPEKPDDASYYFDLGQCHDRIGERDKAGVSYRKAASIDPEGFTEPARFSRDEFKAIVEGALDDIPVDYDEYLCQTNLVLEDFPGPFESSPFVLVKFVRGPRTIGEAEHSGPRDEFIFYKRSLEIEFPGPDVLREELTRAITQELAAVFEGDDELSDA